MAGTQVKNLRIEMSDLNELDILLRGRAAQEETGQSILANAQSTCTILKEIRESGDLGLLIDVEMDLLIKQIQTASDRTPLWATEIQSLTQADEQMASGIKCYEMLTNDVETYKDNTAILVKIAPDRYPHDSFRIFVDGQHTRLQNALKLPYTEAEQVVLEARDENIKAMNRLYKALQKENLPEQTKEIGRLEKLRDERDAQAAEREKQAAKPGPAQGRKDEGRSR